MRNSIKIIAAFAIICTSILFACKQQKQWYEGGTLHNATAAQWRIADEGNKLATCADFVANIKKYNQQQYINLDSMKADAMYFKKFLDEATKPPTPDSEKVAELVAMQSILKR